MISTGMVRQVDNLGRVVIPKELRRTMLIDLQDPLEVFKDGDKIIFKKYRPGCVFCENIEDVINYLGKNVCTECIEKLEEIVK